MAEIVVIAELPIGSAQDVDTTELVLLLREVKPANVIDYVDARDLNFTVANEQPQQEQYYDG